MNTNLTVSEIEVSEVFEVEVVTISNKITNKSKKMRLQETENINDLLFPVEIVENQEFECNPDQLYEIYVYPRGEKIRVNTCSDVYKLVKNEDVFGAARNILINSGLSFSENYEIINDARFYGTYIIENHDFVMSEGDVIKPVMKINHSYNGQTKYSINFGYFRMICSNGLVIPLEEKSEFNLSLIGKHTKKIESSLESLLEKITFFCDNTEVFAANFNLLANRIENNVSERIEEVLKACNISNVSNKNFNTLNWIMESIENEADQLSFGIVTDWLIYNGINRYLYNDNRECEAPETKQAIDSKVLAYMIKTCKARTIQPENLMLNE